MNTQPGLEVEIANLSLSIASCSIFRDITVTLKPNTLVALLGPSGAGKSTLLNSLAGRIPKTMSLTGDILVNGQERTEMEWRYQSGYVEQEFYAYEDQTVYETFAFYNQLKGGTSRRLSQVNSETANCMDEEDKINELINVLNLVSTRSTPISNLSGGERRRVGIGIELINDPNVILLDEPTSGLDSFNALNILETLSNIKTLSKTILVTIHQPSPAMMKYFDKMILMSQGDMIFEGGYQECIEFFKASGFECPINVFPSAFFLDTISLNTTSPELSKSSLLNIKKLKDCWVASKKEDSRTGKDYPKTEIYERNYQSQFHILTTVFNRNLQNYLRNTSYIRSQILQRVVFILIVGLTFLNLGNSQRDIQSRAGVIFFILINSMFGVVGPIFNVFAREKKIIRRERASGYYNGFVMYISKVVVDFVFIAVYNAVYITAVYWMTNLNNSAGKFFIFLLLQMAVLFFAVNLGFTVSAVVKSDSAAQIVGSTLIIIFTLYGGSFNNPKTIPSWLRWLIWVSPVNYANKAMMQICFRGLNFDTDGGNSLATGDDVIAFYGADGINVVSCAAVLILFSLICAAIGSFSLHQSTRLRMKLSSKNF